MAPNVASRILHDTDEDLVPERIAVSKIDNKKLAWVWRNIILMAALHVGALYGLYLAFTSTKFITTIFTFITYQISGLGITAGAHRLWSHKSYKAKRPLVLLLTYLNTMAFQDAAIHWARDHRVHHKYCETDADPHDARRGFFFAHVGWLLCRKHPEVKEKGKQIDLSDLYGDPILRFQKKYYLTLMLLIAFIIPTAIPMYFWGETFKNAYYANLFRYAWTLNATWLVNSAAHMFGTKPYDRFIKPTEIKTVAILAMGEGWHNYHHTFPWDYKTSELGKYSTNFTAAFIDLMAKIGWAYDLKTVSPVIVQKRAERTGDGSHEVWGWGDVDQSDDEKRDAIITHKIKS